MTFVRLGVRSLALEPFEQNLAGRWTVAGRDFGTGIGVVEVYDRGP